MIHLKSFDFQATETLKDNRLRKGLLTDKKTIKKQKGGGPSYSFSINEEMLIVRGLDNTVVNFGTNYDTAELIQKVTHWKKKL